MTELFEFMFEKVNIEQVGELLVNLGFSDENIRSVEVIPTFSYIDSRDFCLKVSSFIKTSTEDVSIFINLNHVLFEFPINMIKPSIQIIKYDGNCEVSFVKLASYEGTNSTGKIKQLLGVNENLEGRTVVILEDIIDTGTTLKYLLENLQTRKPASIKVCTLLSKHARRKVEIAIDYNGFVVPDHFVVGYGLDYAEKYRNLPYIGILYPKVYEKK